ncbi:glucose-6-phosphate isomerase [Eubacteriales bacterium OttesenSCG-928-G02]|nr:glucose-6-phosphate isomerase [Eubacteriales bacterium OttesenSCG-928-G02]
MIKVNDKFIKNLINEDIMAPLKAELNIVDEKIRNKSGAGNDYIGWLDWPLNYDKAEVESIKKISKQIISNTDVFIVIGIGGSYLGAKAAIDFLKTPYYNSLPKNTPDIYFLGNSFSGEELENILTLCDGKRVSVNVISKSGTTTESAIAFRLIKNYMESRYTAEQLKDRIFITTDKQKGALLNYAIEKDYKRFVIPDDIGGRFSVLTAVGLLPIAVCGCDIDAILKGSLNMRNELINAGIENEAYKYALIRNYFLNTDKSIEILVSYDPYLRSFTEWWKQLFGESEGKEGKGLYPSSAIFSMDLHSMGQYIQDGKRILFETVLTQTTPQSTLKVENDSENLDGLNFLTGKTMCEINEKAFIGTTFAHADGGSPTLSIEFDKKDENSFGELCFFFFIACAASAYLLNVNPFNQPGVEAYKKNMFALLGKPGYEDIAEELLKKFKSI